MDSWIVFSIGRSDCSTICSSSFSGYFFLLQALCSWPIVRQTYLAYLYEKVMALEVFDVHVQEERGQLSNNEYSMLTRMGVEVFAVAPYLKRYSGYVYIRNPRRFVGLYGFLQAVSYVCASERNEYKLMDNLNVAVSSKECRSEQEVRIKVFGGLSITTKYGSLDESQISSAQAVRLVAYLLLNDTRKVPQNELTNALWPNSEVDAPAKQVRNVVHRTRAILEPIFPDDLVSSDRAGNYFINPNITVITDASVFESFCRLAQQPAATFKEKLVYLRQATACHVWDSGEGEPGPLELSPARKEESNHRKEAG